MTATFDEATLRRLHEELGAEGDVTMDIVRTFLKSAEDLLAEARAAVGRQEAAVVRRVAHTLKSSAATVGAARLAELSRDLEARLTGGGAARAADVDAMAAEFARARAALAAWRP